MVLCRNRLRAVPPLRLRQARGSSRTSCPRPTAPPSSKFDGTKGAAIVWPRQARGMSLVSVCRCRCVSVCGSRTQAKDHGLRPVLQCGYLAQSIIPSSPSVQARGGEGRGGEGRGGEVEGGEVTSRKRMCNNRMTSALTRIQHHHHLPRSPSGLQRWRRAPQPKLAPNNKGRQAARL